MSRYIISKANVWTKVNSGYQMVSEREKIWTEIYMHNIFKSIGARVLINAQNTSTWTCNLEKYLYDGYNNLLYISLTYLITSVVFIPVLTIWDVVKIPACWVDDAQPLWCDAFYVRRISHPDLYYSVWTNLCTSKMATECNKEALNDIHIRRGYMSFISDKWRPHKRSPKPIQQSIAALTVIT